MYRIRVMNRTKLIRTLTVMLPMSLLCLSIQCLPTQAKRGKHATVKAAMEEYGAPARKKLEPLFEIKGIKYPPSEITMIGLKEERLLYIFAKDKNGINQKINTYPIIGTSGKTGPKLKEGDKQIPEGIYKVTGFKPNSIAHLAILLNYPNGDDKRFARQDKRSDLGSDIEIHGSFWSTGCLAMGDIAIEEIFVLAYDTGCRGIKVILAPCNLNVSKPDVDFSYQPQWLPQIYDKLEKEMIQYEMVSDEKTKIPWHQNTLLQ